MMKLITKFKILIVVMLLVSALGVQAQTSAPSICTTVPTPQFNSTDLTASAVLNGVTVTRTLTRAPYSGSQVTTSCGNNYSAGFAYVRSSGGNTQHSVTYTFDVAQTSVQVFLLDMGRQRTGNYNYYDQADFVINGDPSLPLSFNLNPSSFDCRSTVRTSGNRVYTTQGNQSTDAAIVVSSGTPFTSLTITDPRIGTLPSGTDGQGFYVEICPTSLTPLDSDGDGIPDIDDLDDDNDGILDTDEMDVQYHSQIQRPTVHYQNSVDYPERAVDTQGTSTYATFNNQNDELILDLGTVVPAGTVINLYSQDGYYTWFLFFPIWNELDDLQIAESKDNVTYSSDTEIIFDDDDDVISRTYTLTQDSRYLRIKKANVNSNNLRLYDVTFPTYSYIDRDTDNDGIPDRLDTDSDNDGCPDAVEGSDNVQLGHLYPLDLPASDPNYKYRGQIKATADGTPGTPAQVVNANGVPNLVNPGGAADADGNVGQGAGDAYNALVYSQCAINFWYGSNNPTTGTNWGTDANWTGNVVPAEGADIVFATMANYGATAVNDLVLDINRIVGNVTNGTADKKLIIPVEKTLIINGKANTGTADQLVIKSERGNGNGALVFDNPGINTSVPATVEFASKSQKVNPDVITQYEWQYIGSPVQGATPQNVFGPNVTGSKYGLTDHVLIRKYSEPKHDTSDVGDKWIDVDVNLAMDNFAGYEVVQPDLTAPTYQFKGTLKVGDFSTGELGFTSGAYFRGNYILANSYAAPIRIDKLKATDFYNLEETIYLFNTGSREQWIAGSGWSTGNGQSTVIGTYYTIPRELAHTLGVKQIPSMNGFLVRRLKNAEAGYVSGDSIRFDFRYASLEKTLAGLGTTTPMFVKGVSNTPGTADGESAKKYPLLKIDVVNGTKADRVMLITAPNTTKKFDNGWDGYKMLASGETQIYAFENGTNRFQVNTDSNLDGTILGIYNGSNGSEFKLDFHMGEDMQGVYDVLNIEDLQTGTITDITDGGSYTFTVNSSSPEGRFRINATPRGDTPTDMNNPIKLFYYKNNDVVVINGSDESGALRIYDIAGKLVQEIPITSGQTSKKLKLRNGIYIFDVRTASYNSTHKIIVQ